MNTYVNMNTPKYVTVFYINMQQDQYLEMYTNTCVHINITLTFAFTLMLTCTFTLTVLLTSKPY